MELSIRAEKLCKKFGDVLAVDNVTFDVMAGEIFGFLGPNGAGKTTTIRMLAGMISPSSGKAEVLGLPINGDIQKLHETIELLTESPGFYENLSAKRNLEYFAGFYSGIDTAKQTEKYIKAVGLWERREDKVKTFSKGMKQRLAIARALIHEPKVLFLDEPTAGLDPESAQEIRNIIKDLKREGRTIFISTHNLSEAESLCERIAIIKTSLIALDTIDNLHDKLFKREVVVEMESIDPVMMNIIQECDFARSVKIKEKSFIIEMDDIERGRPILVKKIVDAGGMIQNIYENKHSLEETYLSLVSSEK
ncbi:MAG: ABC transporter ATP-binding protein [bacterium]